MILASSENTPDAWSARARLPVEAWEACGWTFDGQRDRVEEIVGALDPRPGELLLDWGCGTGVLSELVPDTVDYVGFDYADGMVERARREHPGRRFVAWEPLGRFDLVACVGCFNLPDRWSKLDTWHTLRRLWDRTDRALAVSLYAGDDPACLQYTVDECAAFACSEAFYAKAARWRHNDILVVMERTR